MKILKIDMIKRCEEVVELEKSKDIQKKDKYQKEKRQIIIITMVRDKRRII